MKPRTKFQQSVVAASKHLPPLTPAQIEWGYKNCIEHIGRRTPKGLITCTECGHTWQSENGELTDNLLGCECPHCHTPLKVETTLRRKFNDYEYLCIVTRCKGFQVLRFVYIECWAKVGQTPFTPISKPYSGGLPPTDAPQPSHGCARWASSFTGGVGRAHWNCGRRTTGNTTSRPHASIPGNGLSPNCAEAVTANNSPM